MANAPHATLSDIEHLASEITALSVAGCALLDEWDIAENIEATQNLLMIIEDTARRMHHAATSRTATYPVPA